MEKAPAKGPFSGRASSWKVTGLVYQLVVDSRNLPLNLVLGIADLHGDLGAAPTMREDHPGDLALLVGEVQQVKLVPQVLARLDLAHGLARRFTIRPQRRPLSSCRGRASCPCRCGSFAERSP